MFWSTPDIREMKTFDITEFTTGVTLLPFMVVTREAFVLFAKLGITNRSTVWSASICCKSVQVTPLLPVPASLWIICNEIRGVAVISTKPVTFYHCNKLVSFCVCGCKICLGDSVTSFCVCGCKMLNLFFATMWHSPQATLATGWKAYWLQQCKLLSCTL